MIKDFTKYMLDDLKLAALCDAAKHPNASANLLDEISKHDTYMIRCHVASHPNCSKKTLLRLSKDEIYDVKYWVLHNPNASVGALKVLAKDKLMSTVTRDLAFTKLIQLKNLTSFI